MPKQSHKILASLAVKLVRLVAQTIKLCTKYRLVIIPALGMLILVGVYAAQTVTNHHDNNTASELVETSARENIESRPTTLKTNANHSKSKKEKEEDGTAQKSQTSSNNSQARPGSSSLPPTQRSIVDEKGLQPAPDPKPNFQLQLLRPPSNNAFGFILKATEITQPSEITEFSTPEVSFGSGGSPRCGNYIFYINSNDSWGFSCTMYSDAVYGQWPVTFRVTAKNIYNQSAIRTVTGVIVYGQNQTHYSNILKY